MGCVSDKYESELNPRERIIRQAIKSACLQKQIPDNVADSASAEAISDYRRRGFEKCEGAKGFVSKWVRYAKTRAGKK